ncbi:MAG: SPASM domain-containing protein [Synergistaceae bacterium]|nr:SPASM domain-containing protein [Synergistaceae bacterium]
MPLLTEQSLADCINNSFWFDIVNKRVSEFFALNEDCRSCKYLKNCSGGCRAYALVNDPDNYMGKSPMLCELLLGEWPDKIIELVKGVRPDAKILYL